MTLKVLDLFSGIGGFSLGLERAGMQTVAFCEVDPFCQQVLNKHWPHIPIHEDIGTLNGEEYWGDIDLVCGGYPCQGFSVAGKRQGEKDDRYLWPQMLRIIKEARPTYVLAENVAGHITMGLDRVLTDLEAEGYATSAVVIPAVAVDAPHRRDRVWIIGSDTEALANTSSRRCSQPGERETQQQGRTEAVCSSETLADAESIDVGGSNREQTERQEQELGDSSGADWRPWEPEPSVCRVVDGIPNRLDRVKALGNSLVPQIAEKLGRAIIDYENDTRDA